MNDHEFHEIPFNPSLEAAGGERAQSSERAAEPSAAPSKTALVHALGVDENGTDNKGFLFLHNGFDTINLSYKGVLKESEGNRLESLKSFAKDRSTESDAQLQLGGFLFIVGRSGRNKLLYSLIGDLLEIDVGHRGTGSSYPIAIVKIRTAWLLSDSLDKIEMTVRALLERLCVLTDEPAMVSRADIKVDFCADDQIIQNLDQEAFICKAALVRPYYTNRVLTNWEAGLGGAICSRLYNKTAQLKSKAKFASIAKDLEFLWRQAGWDSNRTVWRSEFEFNREALFEFGINNVTQLIANRERLWTYGNQEWLRLTIPNLSDQTVARWPLHPLWSNLWTAGCLDVDQPRIKRVRKNYNPDLHRATKRILSETATIMACEDYEGSAAAFLSNFPEYVKDHEAKHDLSFESYFKEQLKRKRRLFNIKLNDHSLVSPGFHVNQGDPR